MKTLLMALALTGDPANVESVEFLKIKLAAPPPPVCPIETLSSGTRMYMRPRDGSSCVKPFAVTRPAPLPTGPKYTLEAWVSSAPRGIEMVTVEVLDGLVESVNVTTNGYESQAAILSALEDRFGKPEVSSSDPVQTAMGASFEALRASWTVGDVGIQFHGILGRINQGNVRASTRKGHEDLERTYGDRGSF